MDEIIRRVWKFGSHIDTDAIVPGRYLDAPMDEIAAHVFEGVRPEFAGSVKAGDIIISGSNFGCGSSREQAPAVLKAIGIACVAAESFARIFFRNAIAIGLPVLTCKGISEGFEDGHRARLSVDNVLIENLDTGKCWQGDPLFPEMLEIIARGGILEYLKAAGGIRAIS